MKKAGLEVTIDAAGNIIGKKSKNPSLKPIAFSSHIDMVPDGGNYDGCVGSVAALEVMEILKEKHNYQSSFWKSSFANDSTIGSIAMVGHLDADGLQQKSNGF
jgi:N-carbamoyl-L-amino-acid hydrolase